MSYNCLVSFINKSYWEYDPPMLGLPKEGIGDRASTKNIIAVCFCLDNNNPTLTYLFFLKDFFKIHIKRCLTPIWESIFKKHRDPRLTHTLCNIILIFRQAPRVPWFGKRKYMRYQSVNKQAFSPTLSRHFDSRGTSLSPPRPPMPAPAPAPSTPTAGRLGAIPLEFVSSLFELRKAGPLA